MTYKQEKQQIISEYLKLHEQYFKETGRANLPRKVYRLRTNVSEDRVRLHFGGYKGLRNASMKKLKSQSREDVDIKLNADQTINQRYIVSSIVEGSPINKSFFNALKLYCKKNNARLLLLWMKGVYKNDRFNQAELKQFEPYLVTNFKFNKNLEARDFLLSPLQMLPLSGLDRFGSKKTSLIVASTKQMMTSVPRPKLETPHIVYSTGTISVPTYTTSRNGALAKQDNKLGALVVEVVSDKYFYIRNVEWLNNCFVDLGKAYYEDKVKKMDCKVMVWGDLHLGEECPTALRSSLNQAKFFKPDQIFLHDLISFNSISHHNFGKYLSKVFVKEKINTLQKELQYAKDQLDFINHSVDSELVVVSSNHDEFLFKYCNSGQFLKDTPNAILGAKCFIKYEMGINPIEDYMNMKDVIFLQRDQSYKVKDIECGIHGHDGANGAKGSPMGFRNSYDKIIVGHSHSPKIINDVYYVGTLSRLNLSYNRGSSSWLHANSVIYDNGGRQLILWVESENWKMA